MTFASAVQDAPGWWDGRPVAITGASGFIGSHLVAALSLAGAQVHALVRTPRRGLPMDQDRNVTQHRWALDDDAASERLLADIQPEVVFHGAVHRSAAGGSVEPEGAEGEALALRLTVEGGEAFVRRCARHGVRRLVLLGSSSEYGPHDAPLREDMADAPVSLHGRTKAALTAAVRELAAQGLNAVVLRIFYAYGPGDDPRRFIPTVCRAALADEGVRLTPPGFMRDYVHVDNVVTACLRAGALDLEPGETINVGTGQGVDNHELVSIVQSLCAGRPAILSTDFPPRPADTGHWRADTGRMAARLGIDRVIGLHEGLADVLRHMQAAESVGVRP
ncbi:NAD-dependent epimerase/dehydratase family protein [Phenylobacterium sp.]|uniref:NAD-dependent epimerase/dehydratase family protein n=1 Tax=Phenylobacterium sp. TaxID=1871053 RepID=UPI0035638D3D